MPWRSSGGRALLGLTGVSAVIAGAWGLAVAAVAGLQEPMIFPGASSPGSEAAAALAVTGHELVTLPLGEDRPPSLGLFRQGGDRAVIFLHGNGGSLRGADGVLGLWHDAGYTALAVTYPGYLGVDGRPDEDGIASAAHAGWELLRERGFEADHIALYGHSMGGGATALLLDRLDQEPAAVVVQSTFRSLRLVASDRFPFLPVRPLLLHPFEVQSIWARVQAPVMVLHGTADGTIPVSHGRGLAQIIPDVHYVEAEGRGHEMFSLEPRYWGQVLAFLDAHVEPGTAGALDEGPR